MQIGSKYPQNSLNNVSPDNKDIELSPIKLKRNYFKRQSEVNLQAKYKLDTLFNLKYYEKKQVTEGDQTDKPLFVRNINNGTQTRDTYYYFGSQSQSSSTTNIRQGNQSLITNFKQSTQNSPQIIKNILPKFRLLQQVSRRKKIFVLSGNIVDGASIQVIEVDLPKQPKNLSELYKSQEVFIKECQQAFFQNLYLKLLYQPNQVQISFIENIAKSFQFVIICISNFFILARFSSCHYWEKLLQINEIKIKFTEQHLLKLLNAFNQIDDLDEFRLKLKSRSFIKSVLLTGDLIDIQMDPDHSITKNLLRRYDDEEYTSPNHRISLETEPQKPKHQKTTYFGTFADNQQNDMLRDFSMMDQNMTSTQMKKLLKPVQEGRERTEQSSCDIKQTNFIRRNKQKFESKIAKINTYLPILQNLNIPLLIQDVGFDRGELYNVFCKYKSLLLVQSQQRGTKSEKGIDFTTFYQSLDEQMLAQKEMISNLFQNFSLYNRMDWSQYCRAVNLLKAKNVSAKMKLIMRLIDKNADGLLSFDEINEKCFKMLSKLMPSKGDSPKLLSDFMTRTIFDAVNVNYEDNIQISQIKHMIETDHPEVELLLMICSGE